MHIFLKPNAIDMFVIKSGEEEEEELATPFLKCDGRITL